MDRPTSRGEPADEHGAGQEAARDLGNEAVRQLELTAFDSPRRGQRHGVRPVGAAHHLRIFVGTDREPAGLVTADEAPDRGGSSKRVTHHQSIEPSGATSAAERVSPMSP